MKFYVGKNISMESCRCKDKEKCLCPLGYESLLIILINNLVNQFQLEGAGVIQAVITGCFGT